MPWLTDRRLLAAAWLAWLAMALLGLVLGPPLGHDEAAFAVAARDGAPAGAWLYRSDGTIAIATPPGRCSGSDLGSDLGSGPGPILASQHLHATPLSTTDPHTGV